MHRFTPHWIARLTTAVALTGAAAVLLLACSGSRRAFSLDEVTGEGGPLPRMRERHLRNIRQLTFGGQNAESYFSHEIGRAHV